MSAPSECRERRFKKRIGGLIILCILCSPLCLAGLLEKAGGSSRGRHLQDAPPDGKISIYGDTMPSPDLGPRSPPPPADDSTSSIESSDAPPPPIPVLPIPTTIPISEANSTFGDASLAEDPSTQETANPSNTSTFLALDSLPLSPASNIPSNSSTMPPPLDSLPLSPAGAISGNAVNASSPPQSHSLSPSNQIPDNVSNASSPMAAFGPEAAVNMSSVKGSEDSGVTRSAPVSTHPRSCGGACIAGSVIGTFAGIAILAAVAYYFGRSRWRRIY